MSWRFNDDWKSMRKNLLNDLHILNESAKKKNIKIFNLSDNIWYNEFEKGNLTDFEKEK